MRSANSRLERLEQHTSVCASAGPSLIVLTALGRGDEEVRAIRLSSGEQLNRKEGEGGAEFRARASDWAAAFGKVPAQLATAVYAAEEHKESCK